jgi:hypothetical protein
VELNWTEIPNPRWKGNEHHFNSVVWMYMIFVVEIKGWHPIPIHVWMRKPWNLMFC